MAVTEQDKMAQQVAGESVSGGPKRLAVDDEGHPIVRPQVTVETPFTGSGNLTVGTHKLAPGEAFRLTEVELHLSATPTSGTQALVITKDDGGGTAYDLVILSIDLVANAVADLVIKPDKPCKATDIITAAWTNTDARTYGLIFKHQVK